MNKYLRERIRIHESDEEMFSDDYLEELVDADELQGWEAGFITGWKGAVEGDSSDCACIICTCKPNSNCADHQHKR